MGSPHTMSSMVLTRGILRCRMSKRPSNTCQSFYITRHVFFLTLLHSSIHLNAHMSSPCPPCIEEMILRGKKALVEHDPPLPATPRVRLQSLDTLFVRRLVTRRAPFSRYACLGGLFLYGASSFPLSLLTSLNIPCLVTPLSCGGNR
jgi:hypothetical protein